MTDPQTAPAPERSFPDVPIRQRSAGGPSVPNPFWRSCRHCHADFIDLAPGKTGERGLWSSSGGMYWWCSQECWDADHG